MGYVQIRSWHIILTPTRVPNTYTTLCGRRASGRTATELPGTGKTCETCLRLARMAGDKAATLL